MKHLIRAAASETGSPAAEHQHQLDSLMPMTSTGTSLSAAAADWLMICGRWRVTVPRVFLVLLPSQSIDPNSQHSLFSLGIIITGAADIEIMCVCGSVSAWTVAELRMKSLYRRQYINTGDGKGSLCRRRIVGRRRFASQESAQSF